MHTTIRIDFIFEDFVEAPETITNFLGLQPDKTHVKGEIIPTTGVKWKHSVWLISSKIDETESFESHLDDIMNKIDSKYDKFLEISKRSKTYLNCVVTMYDGDRPYLGFKKEILKILCALNTEIGFDIYNF